MATKLAGLGPLQEQEWLRNHIGPDGNQVGRNGALARAAALLNEKDFDMAQYLLVVYGQQKRKWGMATTQATCTAQTQQVHEDMFLFGSERGH